MSKKVFKYGAVTKSIGDDVREQLKLARVYYNRLVEAENARREAAWGAPQPPLPPTHVHQASGCQVCRTHWAAVRQRVYDAPNLDVIPFRATAVAEGLWWGTYLKVEEAFSLAVRTKPLKRVRFRSWRQGGTIAVQIQRPHLSHKQFRVEKAPDARTGRRAGQRHTVQLRIASVNRNGVRGVGHTPVWSTPVQFEMHRPFGLNVKWVLLHQTFVGEREVWSVQFVCAGVPTRQSAPRGVVAVDVGWRRIEDGSVRLAFARGDDGVIRQLIMSPHWCEQNERADRIRSHRDKRLGELQAQYPALNQLRSPASVAHAAAKHNIQSAHLDAWIKRERHLHQYESGCRYRSVLRRRHALAEWICELQRNYATVILKDTKHKELKEEKNLPKPARRRGHHGAPGEIIERAVTAFGAANVEIVAAPYTTATCPTCQHINNHGPERIIVCESCGAIDDRDVVSTRNMMLGYAAGATTKPTARKTTPRFAKRHKKSTSPDNASP